MLFFSSVCVQPVCGEADDEIMPIHAKQTWCYVEGEGIGCAETAGGKAPNVCVPVVMLWEAGSSPVQAH